MAAPFIYRRPSGNGTGKDALIMAALDGDLGRLKGIKESLGNGNGSPAVVLSLKKNGMGVLHCAACAGHLEVCKYLVEELRGDANMTRAEGMTSASMLFKAGMTPLMTAAQSGDVSTVKYLLGRGGDLMKTDERGHTVLHHAAGTGSSKVIEFLLSKGIPVDIDCGRGTALCQAAINEQDKTVKILLDHHADDERHIARRKAVFKLKASKAFKPKEYDMASKIYGLIMQPDATLYSNRSLCRLQMGDGEGALADAYKCRMMRPGWAKGCYRQAAAHMLLGEHKQACDALLDAQKLDPGNEEIERELRKAVERMKVSSDEGQQ